MIMPDRAISLRAILAAGPIAKGCPVARTSRVLSTAPMVRPVMDPQMAPKAKYRGSSERAGRLDMERKDSAVNEKKKKKKRDTRRSLYLL